jgi:hypothetical protein
MKSNVSARLGMDDRFCWFVLDLVASSRSNTKKSGAVARGYHVVSFYPIKLKTGTGKPYVRCKTCYCSPPVRRTL